MSDSTEEISQEHAYKIPWDAQSTALSKSASENMIVGPLPPSSSVTGFKLLRAAASMIRRPTSVEPVKAILSTSMCEESAAPMVPPGPFTMLTTPGGKPTLAMSFAMYRAVSGVNSDGFSTTVFPVASAGAIFQVNRRTEKG
jgi:hypothetical protein